VRGGDENRGGNRRDGRVEHGPAMVAVAAHAARGFTGRAVVPRVALDGMVGGQRSFRHAAGAASSQMQAARLTEGATISSARTQAAIRPPRFRHHVIARRMAVL
jgi:hypothetical protein